MKNNQHPISDVHYQNKAKQKPINIVSNEIYKKIRKGLPKINQQKKIHSNLSNLCSQFKTIQGQSKLSKSASKMYFQQYQNKKKDKDKDKEKPLISNKAHLKGQTFNLKGQAFKCQTIKSQQIIKIQKRKDILISSFLIHLLFNLMVSFQSIYLFFTLDSTQKNVYTLISFMTMFIYLLVSSYFLTSIWDMFMLYILIDTIMVSSIVASLGFIGMMIPVFQGNWPQYVMIIGVPILYFTLAGNARVFIKCTRLIKWQLLLLKFCLGASALCYFTIGVYYMANDYKPSKGMDPELDSKVKDFVLLFVFGSYSFYMQLYGLVSSFDKTGQLKYDYQIVDSDSDQEDNNFNQIKDLRKVYPTSETFQNINVQQKVGKKQNFNQFIYEHIQIQSLQDNQYVSNPKQTNIFKNGKNKQSFIQLAQFGNRSKLKQQLIRQNQ